MKINLILLFGILPLVANNRYHDALHDGYRATDGEWVTSKLAPDDTTSAIFYDNFSGGFPGQWLGDTMAFRVVDKRLCIAERTTAPTAIVVPSPRLRNTVWEAGVQVDGAWSASTYIRLYIAITSPSTLGPQWGYHLQIDGDNENHVYRLWRQNGLTRSIAFESNAIPNQGGGFRARIRITCTNGGLWQISADEYDGGSFGVIPAKGGETTIKDDTYTTGGYSGYFANFSPIRWRDFRLDYLLIKPLDPTADPDLPESLRPGDILINEVLSHPNPGGVDFVEIYNYSNKPVDLSHIHIARVNATGAVGPRLRISDHPLFLYPNEYKVLTTRPAVVKQQYPQADTRALIEMPALPNFNNETGGIVLYSNHGMIDSLFYTPEMQSPFTVRHQGISVERQRFSVPTNARGNFQSAAVAIGGATPGYKNSQQIAEADESGIVLTSKTFSPDSDGFEDWLEINYHLPESGFMANIDIYTVHGTLVRRLQRNQSLATQGTIYWDGLSDANQRLPVGMYIAVVEIYNARGVRKVYRKSFVLAARL